MCISFKQKLITGAVLSIGCSVIGLGVYSYLFYAFKELEKSDDAGPQTVRALYIVEITNFGLWLVCSAVLVFGAMQGNERVVQVCPWLTLLFCLVFGICQNVVLSLTTNHIVAWVGVEVLILIGLLLTLMMRGCSRGFVDDARQQGPLDPVIQAQMIQYAEATGVVPMPRVYKVYPRTNQSLSFEDSMRKRDGETTDIHGRPF